MQNTKMWIVFQSQMKASSFKLSMIENGPIIKKWDSKTLKIHFMGRHLKFRYSHCLFCCVTCRKLWGEWHGGFQGAGLSRRLVHCSLGQDLQ